VNVPIPEDDISGPVLALAGGDDSLVTDAGQSANEIAFDLASDGGDRYPGGGRGWSKVLGLLAQLSR
jgi:hypothetical protein